MRHLNNGTDHRHSKSCCDQSSPARRTMKMAIVQFLVIEYFVIQNDQRILARLRCTFRYLKFDIDFPFYFARSLSSAMEVISAVDVPALTLAPGHQQLKLPYLLSLLSTTWFCHIPTLMSPYRYTLIWVIGLRSVHHDSSLLADRFNWI